MDKIEISNESERNGSKLDPHIPSGGEPSEFPLIHLHLYGKVVLVIILVLAIIFVRRYGISTAQPDSPGNSRIIQALDEKQEKVMSLTAALTASSIAVSAIPDDTATPIAQKLMDMTSYLFVSLGAIVIEKYALVLFQYLGLAWIVPIGLFCLLITVFLNIPLLKKAGIKLIFLGILMASIVAGSEKASSFIYGTYEESINTTIDNAAEASEAYENGMEEENKAWYEVLAEKAGDLVNTVVGAVDWAKNILNQFVEAVIVMLVTCCIIPIITVLIFIFMMKWLIGVNVNMSDFSAPLTDINRKLAGYTYRSVEHRKLCKRK